MTSVKDLERCARLFEKEIAVLAEQMGERESALRLEVDRLRARLGAVERFLAEVAPVFADASCRRGGNGLPPAPARLDGEQGADGAEDCA